MEKKIRKDWKDWEELSTERKSEEKSNIRKRRQEEKNSLVSQLVDSHAQVSRHLGTRVHVEVVFRYQIHVVEDEAVEEFFLESFDEGCVHNSAFVESLVAVLRTKKA